MDSHYGKARSALFVTASYGYYWSFIDSETSPKFFGIELTSLNNASWALAYSVFVAFSLLWTILEWFKFPIATRKLITSRIDFWVSMLFGMGILFVLVKRITSASIVWDLSPFLVLGISFVGLITGFLLSTLVFALRFIRSSSRALKIGAPRVPAATAAQLYLLPVVLILATTVYWYISTELQNIQAVLMAIYVFPIIVSLISTLIEITFMDQGRYERLQKVYDKHDASYRMHNLRFDIKIGDQNFNEITRPLTKHELACLREHFETGLDPNQVGANGWTLMMLLAANCDEEATRMCIEFGGDVNASNVFDRSAISFAANYGNTSMVKLLIDNHADVEGTDDIGPTPLMVASRSGHLDVVKLLLSAGADPTKEHLLTGQTALDAAVSQGFGEVAGELRRAILKKQRSSEF